MNERIAARVILLNEHNQVLLLSIHEEISYWMTPGGGVEHSETLLETATRELFEETAIRNATIHKNPSWYSESVLSYKGTPTLFKQHYFIGRVKNSVVSFDGLQQDEQSIKSYQWCNLQDLTQLVDRVYPISLPMMLSDYFAHGITECKTIIEI